MVKSRIINKKAVQKERNRRSTPVVPCSPNISKTSLSSGKRVYSPNSVSGHTALQPHEDEDEDEDDVSVDI